MIHWEAGRRRPLINMASHHWQWLGLSCLLASALARDQATLSAAVGSEVIVETKAGSLAGKQMEEVVGCVRMAVLQLYNGTLLLT
jgi:hypothetical protein